MKKHAARRVLMTFSVIDPIELTRESVKCKSITPDDDGALDVMVRPLVDMGFSIHRMTFSEKGTHPIDNVFAQLGGCGRHICYMGHTDVVPVGRDSDWTHPPFAAEIHDGKLYGRGVADMKGGNCAFVAAVSRFLIAHPDFDESISLLLTGDEESVAVNGTVKVIDWMKENEKIPDVALVGEPGNPERMGQLVRVGRRGSLNGRIEVRGIQGHSAYPERADNPLPRLVRLVSALIEARFDGGSADFPPTHCVIASIDTGNTAPNIIPARAEAIFNVRFNDNWTSVTLERHIRKTLDAVGVPYHLTVWSNAESFVTGDSPWRHLVIDAVAKISGTIPKADAGGGTSDARFMARYCPVVEYGLVNATIHKVDEHSSLADILILTDTYTEILERYFYG